MAKLETEHDGENTSQDFIDELLPKMLKEYDVQNKELQELVEFYKNGHENLRMELSSLTNENQSLADQLQKELNYKLNNNSVSSPRHRKDTDMVANLQRQLLLIVQEKDSAVEMWQMALRELDSLEEELRAYRDDQHLELAHRQFDGMKQEYSTAITMLEEKLVDVRTEMGKERALRESLQQQLTDALTDKVNLEQSLNEREQQMDAALQGHQSALERLRAVEAEKESLYDEVQTLRESQDELESAVSTCHQRIEDLTIRENEARTKVKEALSLVESSLADKDAMLVEQNRLVGENARLQKTLSDLIEDAGVKVKEEVSLIKNQFNSKMELLLHDMQTLQVNLNEKTINLEKTIKDRDMLEAELEKVRHENIFKDNPESFIHNSLQKVYQDLSNMEKSNFELKFENEKLLDKIHHLKDSHQEELLQKVTELQNMFQDLVNMEKCNLKMKLETEKLLSKINQMQESHRVELLQKLTEYQALEEQLKALQMISSQNSQAALAQVDSLVRHIESLNAQWAGDNSQREWSYQQWLQQNQNLYEQLNEVQKKGLDMAKELQRHLKSQVSVKHKWQNKLKSLIDKFEERRKSLRARISYLKEMNCKLEQELIETRNEVESYRKQSEQTSCE